MRNWRCLIHGHMWRLDRLHMYQLVGSDDHDLGVHWRCERCGAEREETLYSVHVGITIEGRHRGEE